MDKKKKRKSPSKGIDLKLITDAIVQLAQKIFNQSDFNTEVCIFRNILKEAGANDDQLFLFEVGVVSAREVQNFPKKYEYRGNGG
jgi:hypothetical protein